jgi:hypothetical protein
MRPFRTDVVSTQEWRWVAFFGGFLAIVTLLPFAWAMLVSNHTWAFLGVLINPQDGASYFAKIQQGIEGHWLFELRYTPEAHDSAGLFTFYLLLGHLARILGFSTVVIFHLARIVTSLFMFTALYQLGAHVWQRLRPRRLFFALTAVASGFGWLALFFLRNNSLPPDLAVPEAFPLYAAYANPHFPLSIGCLALLAGIYLEALRPGFNEGPSAENGGSSILIYAVILAIVQPPALVGIGGGLVLLIAVNGYLKRTIPWHEIRWGAMIWLPALPLALYYLLVFKTNKIMGEFNEQNVTPSPNILLTLIGYGLLAVIAMPGIIRAVRRFERDGDQFMLLWLVANVIALYMPFALQRRFFIGLIIPLGFFAVRAIEDYWFYKINPRWHRLALILGFVVMLPSNVIVLGIPLVGAVGNREQGQDAGIVIRQDYIEVYNWLNQVGYANEVVLASPRVSAWIPARTSLRVVYGHPFETVPAKQRERQVKDFFSGRDCATLFNVDRLKFKIDYVIWGPQERKITQETRKKDPNQVYQDCTVTLGQMISSDDQKRTFGSVTVYILRELR